MSSLMDHSIFQNKLYPIMETDSMDCRADGRALVPTKSSDSQSECVQNHLESKLLYNMSVRNNSAVTPQPPSDDKPHKCDYCEKTFKRRDKLKLHHRTHTGEKPHSCNICEKKFNRRDKLTLHLRTHTGEKPHACTVCGRRFTRKDGLKSHLLRHAAEAPKNVDQYFSL